MRERVGRRARLVTGLPRMCVFVTGVLLIFNALPQNHAWGHQATSENHDAIPESVGVPQAADAFARVRAFVRTGVDQETTGVRTSVASVTLLHRGERVSYGVSQDETDPVGDAMRRAVGIANARAELMPDRASTSEEWSIVLELGGAWTPREAPTWKAMGTYAKPGIRGVGARLGEGDDQETSVLMPTQQLRYGLGPTGVWRRVFAEAGAPIGVFSDVVRFTGIRLYTFNVTRVAEPVGTGVIEFPHRAGNLVGLEEMTTPELHESARGMVRFLVAQRLLGVRSLGMSGDVVLATGERAQDAAPVRVQLVAALALARCAHTVGMDPETSAMARTHAIGLLHDALLVEAGETLFAEDPVGAAVFMVAAAEIAQSGPLDDTITGALGQTRELVIDFGTSPQGARIEAGVAAVIALALTLDTNELDGPEMHADAGVTIARALMQELGSEGAHVAMPWLGWALVEGSKDADRVRGDLVLQAFRDRCARFQVRESALDAEDIDLAGGFLWGEEGVDFPDWRSARLTAFLGTMLGDDRLTKDDTRALHLDRLRRSLRFVRQLQVDEEEAWATNSTGTGAPIGGVRRVAWGGEAAIDATSMSLLALCEAIDGVSRAFGK